MLTKKQLTLLKPFLGANIFKEYGVRELARASNENSNNSIQLAIHQFIKEKVVTERKQGTSKLYKINLSNDLSYSYLELIKYEDIPKEVIHSIEELKKEIEKYTLFYSLVVFGSYAIDKQNKKSDLDLAVIVPDETIKQNIKIASNLAKTSTIIPLHVEVISSAELFKMLINKEANLGKEIAKKHRAVHNLNIFYKILKQSIENGYQC